MALIPGTLPTGTKYPNDPQSLLDTFASYLTAPEAKKNRAIVTLPAPPAAGGTLSAGSSGIDETVVLNNTTTYATFFFTFPSTNNSVVGQILRFFTRSIVTTLTVNLNGNTVLGAALPTGTTSGQSFAWQKIDGTNWIRLQ
jgi:hypothetical protein